MQNPDEKITKNEFEEALAALEKGDPTKAHDLLGITIRPRVKGTRRCKSGKVKKRKRKAVRAARRKNR